MRTHRRPEPARYGPILRPAARRWAYGIAAAAAPLATAYGLVTNEQSVLWLNLAASVLFIMAVGNTPSRPTDAADAGSALTADPHDQPRRSE